MNTDDPVVLEVSDGFLSRLRDALKLEQGHDDLMKPYSAADALAAAAAIFMPSVSAGDAVVRTDPWTWINSGRRWDRSTEAPGTFEARVKRNRAKAKAAKAARKKQRGK